MTTTIPNSPPPALLIPEKERPCKLSNGPKLSYSMAMSRYFLTQQGEIAKISSCSDFQFAELIRRCLDAETNKKRKAAKQCCIEELTGIEYTEMLGRCYRLKIIN